MLPTRMVARAKLGARIGFISGCLVTLADSMSVLSAGYPGRRLLLPLGVAALVVPCFTVIGVIAASWLELVSRRTRESSAARRPWLAGALATLPLSVGVLWVPWGWLTSHWASLGGRHKLLAVTFYLLTLVGFAVLGRFAHYVRLRYQIAPRSFHWPLGAAIAALGVAFYWLDRSLYVDDYQDFHYGAAGVFGLATGLVALLGHETWRRFRPSVVGRPKPYVDWFGSTALLALFLLAALDVLGVTHAKALVYGKLAQTLQTWTDFDRDGYSSILGSSDCAPFDAARSPGKVDLPKNGIDDDCSGTDAARWPQPAGPGDYEIPKADGYNLLLITIDTLRADRLGAYGYARKTSPNIDALAAQAVRFANAYSQSTKTHESMPSLFTGLYPANVPTDYKTARTKGKKPYLYTLTDEAVVLTQLLKQQGYHTYAEQNLWVLYTLGLDRGFDDYRTVEEVTAPVLETVRSPFFLWLHYFELHDPYVLHPPFNFGTSDSDRYDSEIAQVDSLVGKVLARLRERNLEGSTIVVVTADHGEEFGEHGGKSHTFKLYRETTHVPLIIKVPGLQPAVIDEPVELVDVLPTLCEALHLKTDRSAFDGQSLWATRAGKRDSGFGFVGAYSQTNPGRGTFLRQSVVTQQFRFDLNIDAKNVELFDTQVDPQERQNIATSRPDIVRALWDEVGLHPFRSLARPFERAAAGDVEDLARSLPRIRNETLLAYALQLIDRHKSPTALQAVTRLRTRPGLSPALREQVAKVLNH